MLCPMSENIYKKSTLRYDAVGVMSYMNDASTFIKLKCYFCDFLFLPTRKDSLQFLGSRFDLRRCIRNRAALMYGHRGLVLRAHLFSSTSIHAFIPLN